MFRYIKNIFNLLISKWRELLEGVKFYKLKNLKKEKYKFSRYQMFLFSVRFNLFKYYIKLKPHIPLLCLVSLIINMILFVLHYTNTIVLKKMTEEMTEHLEFLKTENKKYIIDLSYYQTLAWERLDQLLYCFEKNKEGIRIVDSIPNEEEATNLSILEENLSGEKNVVADDNADQTNVKTTNKETKCPVNRIIKGIREGMPNYKSLGKKQTGHFNPEGVYSNEDWTKIHDEHLRSSGGSCPRHRGRRVSEGGNPFIGSQPSSNGDSRIPNLPGTSRRPGLWSDPSIPRPPEPPFPPRRRG